jgi:dTDP-4-amino-4,6-dideoxygalactose transaminase
MIPFNKPHLTGKELDNISEAHSFGQLSGDGHFTKLCHEWLERATGSCKVLLTHSCTAALEMCAILADINPGDEVIMPSYTFVSTANAFVLRGGVPVFVDIRADTLNLNESLIERAITMRTKAIVPVHYAGGACEMDAILEIAKRNKLTVIEDAAQSILSTYKGKALGSLGEMGTFSFHETKNIISGEGGALLLNNPSMVQRAEIIREKGTNRSLFFQKQVDKYTWVDIGSSYLPGEIIAAFLDAQLSEAQSITEQRLVLWNKYHEAFSELEQIGKFRRPVFLDSCQHNAHMYYLLMNSLEDRAEFIEFMRKQRVQCVFHYVPLHSSPAGKKYARTDDDLPVTEDVECRMVRLPLWIGINTEKVIKAVENWAS